MRYITQTYERDLRTEDPVISYDRITHVRCKALFPPF